MVSQTGVTSITSTSSGIVYGLNAEEHIIKRKHIEMTAESSGLLVRNARDARRPQGGVGIAAHSSRDRTHGTPAGQLAHPAMAGGEPV